VIFNLIATHKRFFAELLAILAVIVALGISAVKAHNLQKRIVDLQNENAKLAPTIEENKGLYARLAQQDKDVRGQLDLKDVQLKELSDQIEAAKEELGSAVAIQLKWKHAYEATIAGTQTVIPPTVAGGPERTKVDFNKDFGSIIVGGYTLTNPAEAYVKVSQGVPLKVAVAVSQDKTKAWHAYATSSDDNIGIDITLASVNPWINDLKWYEKIGISASVAVSPGEGLLAGAGFTYKFNKVEVGPSVFADVGPHATLFYGAGAIWHPFERDQ
jgi:hypothetical protein